MNPMQSFKDIKAALEPSTDKEIRKYHQTAIKSLNTKERAHLYNGLRGKGVLSKESIEAINKVRSVVADQMEHKGDPNYNPLAGRSSGRIKSIGRKWDNLFNSRIGSKKIVKAFSNTERLYTPREMAKEIYELHRTIKEEVIELSVQTPIGPSTLSKTTHDENGDYNLRFESQNDNFVIKVDKDSKMQLIHNNKSIPLDNGGSIVLNYIFWELKKTRPGEH